MALTIFYSWQSDLPNNINRNFIESVLEKAIEILGQVITVEDAPRLDKDTKGVPGSPPIVDTIFTKISNCAIFVPDLTFVGRTENGRLIPNPNVLIEYGWALRDISHARIIPVMNSAFGEPTSETLPFDMRHLRHPITYRLTQATEPQEKANIKAELVKVLVDAIRTVIESDVLEDRLPKPEPFKATPYTMNNPSRFLGPAEPLGTTYTGTSYEGVFATEKKELYVSNNENIFLRIIPTVLVEPIKSGKVAEDAIQRNKLQPMGNWARLTYGRNTHGAFVCDHSDNVLTLTQLFLNCEIWGVDTQCVNKEKHMKTGNVDFGYFPSVYVEKVFNMALTNYLEFSSKLMGPALPLRFIAGATNVKGFKMALRDGSLNQFDGDVIKDHIIFEGEITDYNAPSSTILRPFFNHLWEECGLDRPDKEHLG